jgi:uncharacterized protein YggE
MNIKILLLSVAASLPLLAGDPATIKVLGVAEERVPPDQLQLSCAIRTEGKELAEVAAANRELAGTVTKLLRDQGLGEAEITTGSASFGENTEYKGGRHIKIGYLATTSISVATDKLGLYDKLWFELAKYPEVSISAADFTLKDRSEVRTTARKKALEAARNKAGEMAAALDTRIGAPLSITENPQASPFSFSNNANNSISADPSGDSERGPLEPGLVSVVERVEVTFELLKQRELP